MDWLTPEEWTALRLSLLVATTGTLASLILGLGVAYLLARGRLWGKTVLDRSSICLSCCPRS